MTDLEYLKILPYESDYNPPERIVCAANLYQHSVGVEGIFLVGIRHCDDYMYNQEQALSECDVDLRFYKETQGFLTSKYRFVDRVTAWKIALEQRQIVRLVGSQTYSSAYEETELFSENLY